MKRIRIKPKRLDFISIVSNPANDTDCVKLSKAERLTIVEPTLRVMWGVVARPNFDMLRIDEQGNKYNVYFTEEDILEMYNQFTAKTIEFDVEHNNKPIKVDVLESYIVTNDNNMFGVENGSWVMTVRVEDDAMWELAKQGKLNGFSPEVICEQDEHSLNKDSVIINNIIELLNIL